jgi:hypothetical protein
LIDNYCKGEYKSSVGFFNIKETLEVQKLWIEFEDIPKGSLIAILPRTFDILPNNDAPPSLDPRDYQNQPNEKIRSCYNNIEYEIPIHHFLIYQAFISAFDEHEKEKQQKTVENLNLYEELKVNEKLEEALNEYLSIISKIRNDIDEKKKQSAILMSKMTSQTEIFTEEDRKQMLELPKAKGAIVSIQSEYDLIRNDLKKLTELIGGVSLSKALPETFNKIDAKIRETIDPPPPPPKQKPPPPPPPPKQKRPPPPK